MKLYRVAIVVSSLVACSGVAPSASREAMPATETPAVQRVEIAMNRREAGATVRVHAGDAVRTGDLVELWVTPSRAGYAYVVQFFADGTFDMLFPSSGTAERLEAGQRQRVPARPGAWLKVAGATGEEHVHVLIAEHPLATISPALATALGLATSGQATGSAAPPVESVVAPVVVDAGVPTPPETAPSPSGETRPRARRRFSSARVGARPLEVTYDHRTKALEEVIIDDTPVPVGGSSGIAVQTFWFVHVP